MVLISNILTMINVIDFASIFKYILFIIIPIIVLYLAYLIATRAFKDMGFSTWEAIIIIILSSLFEFQIFIGQFNISNIYIFTYNNWNVAINMGGAIIPIIICIYLIWKKKLDWKKLCLGVLAVTIITFFVTKPVPERGIVSSFPYWLLPAVVASLASVLLLYKDYSKAAPFAYISGTFGVLIGADVFHLSELLSNPLTDTRTAVIGGAVVVDMVFITGILAVILDSILLSRQRKKQGFS